MLPLAAEPTQQRGKEVLLVFITPPPPQLPDRESLDKQQ
jgi:hypothetical protein